MISFERVEKNNIKYTMLYPWINFFHEYIFYRKYYVLHRKRIPKDKPVVAISNHQNGLSDALAILFAFRKDGRYPVFIARGDIFKKDFVSKLLRFLRIMPAYRAVDVGREKVIDNNYIFSKAGQIVANNGVICLFPEAGHEDCHHLGTFKKGFARIAFQAAEELNYSAPVYIVPFSNHYSEYFGYQHKLIVTVGEPYTFEDLYELNQTYPEKARKLLAERSREKVEVLMFNIKDKELYEEYDMLRTIYAKNIVTSEHKKVSYYPNIMEAEKKIVKAIDDFREEKPEQFEELMIDTRAYTKAIDKLHIYDWMLAEKLSFGAFLLRTLYAILLIPALLYGLLNNFLPYNASVLVTRKIKDRMLHNSFHFAMGALVSFPIWFIAVFVTVWCITHTWWIALLYLVTVPVSFIVYLRGKIIIKKQLMRFVRFDYWWHGNENYLKAKTMRSKLVETLDRLFEKKTS